MTRDTGRGVRAHFWAFTNRHLLYLQDKNGDENWRLHAVDLTEGVDKELTPFEGVQVRVVALSHKFPGEVVVGLNNRDPKWHDIHKIDIKGVSQRGQELIIDLLVCKASNTSE